MNLTCRHQYFLRFKILSKNFRGDIAQTLTSHEAQCTIKNQDCENKQRILSEILFYVEHCAMIIEQIAGELVTASRPSSK